MPSEDNIAKLTQENAELREEISVLKRRKKFGLVWEDKPEEVVDRCQSELPVLQEVKTLAIGNDDNLQTNLLIEGDNFHALSVLNYTHARKIDVIYIDPPYNTGAKDWKYNNDYVDDNDGYRHSKWLSMMASRLWLAKKLLAEGGFIGVAIDHNELFTVGCLLDEIFGENNRLGVVAVVNKPEGRNQEKFFSASNDYMLVYAKNLGVAKFNDVVISEEAREKFTEEDEHGKFRWVSYISTGMYSLAARECKPNFWYPIYVSQDLQKVQLKKQRGFHEVFPVTSTNRQKTWRTVKETTQTRIKNKEIAARETSGRVDVVYKLRERQTFTTIWSGKRYNSTEHGTKLLNKLLGASRFNYPKSVYTVEDFLQITSKKNSVVLDFFAGSGTTGHAVLLLNNDDGGNRQFILCTNNESNIARDVCQPRVKAVIKGHAALPDITGIPSNLKYYKTDFVSSVATDPNKIKITNRATEMLCVRENTFVEVKATKSYKIFRNQKRYTGIIYAPSVIDVFKKAVAKIDGVFNVYIFSFGGEDFAEDFADLRGKVTTQPIPAGILNAYRNVFKRRQSR